MARQRRLSFRDGSSDKFWHISVEGKTTSVAWGRTGTAGQQQAKTWADEAEADGFFDKMVAEKLKKGYIDAAGAPEPQAATTSQGPAGAAPVAKPRRPKRSAKAPAIPPPPMPPVACMVKALEVLNVEKETIASFERDVSNSPPDWRLKFDTAFGDKTVLTDWKIDPIEPLFNLSTYAAALGVSVEIDRARGKIVLDIDGGDYLIWNGAKKADVNELAAAFAMALGHGIQVFRLRSLDDADQYGHVMVSAAQGQALRKALGTAFDVVFGHDEPAARFEPAPRPKPRKIDWRKEYFWINGNPPRYDRKSIISEFNRRLTEALKISIHVPPPKLKSDQHPGYALYHAVRNSDPIYFERFYVADDAKDLATFQYCVAQMTYVALLWNLYLWRLKYWNDGLYGYTVPNATTVRGMFNWAYFIFYALGRDAEAGKMARLLPAPVVAKDWFGGEMDKDEPWHWLARHFVTGKGLDKLGAWPPIVRLLEREAWKDPMNVQKALRIHTVKLGETISNESIGNWCWPAPLYALARKAGAVDLLPRDNPFLRWPLVGADIDMGNQYLAPWIAAAAELEKADVSTFPGLQADALVNKAKLLAQLRAKGKPAGQAWTCPCGAVLNIRDAVPPETGGPSIRCPACSTDRHLVNNGNYVADLLVRAEEYQKGK